MRARSTKRRREVRRAKIEWTYHRFTSRGGHENEELSGPPHNKEEENSQNFFSLACLVGPRQGDRRAKNWMTDKDTGWRAISYPDDHRLRNFSNRSYNKKRRNRYGRILFGKTSVSPNVVREEIRYLNRSYNKKANETIRKSPIRQDISFTKRDERGDKISQQKLQQEANEPIRKNPIRQNISSTKRGEWGDKISQQKLRQEANKPIRKSPIRQDISSTKRGERGDKISQTEVTTRKRTTKTLDDERYHIQKVKDFGTSTKKKRKYN